MKLSPEQRYAHAEHLARKHAEREPVSTDWGLFTESARFAESDERQGFFLWFDSIDALLAYLPDHCVYWCCPDEPEKSIHRVLDDTSRLVAEFTKNRCSQEDLLFRVNNLLIPSGMDLTWMGPFSDLLFGTDEIPRRTRLFCRRTLADMEEHSINPLDDSPLPSDHLGTFIECLGDFGLEGQGLNNVLPSSISTSP